MFLEGYRIFELESQDGRARAGILTLPHGLVHTPIFMPVGTQGSVKTLVSEELTGAGAEIILGNTYHLYLRPGLDIIRSFGDLHRFAHWQKPILTDSGGYQVFSLASLRKITEEGCRFRNHLNGALMNLTPELAVEIQEALGSDIHMVLDECTPYPADVKTAKDSMERSMRWAKRSREARTKRNLNQFGIIQGGMHLDLRSQSANALMEIGFEGYAIGGLSVGEPKEDMIRVTDHCCTLLPQDKPRYLMGVGTPLDILRAIELGVDMFDCVMPTRNARNGSLFTSHGRVNIKNKRHEKDHAPLDEACGCYTCQHYSRAYLRHLFVAKELTVLRLLSLHNVTYYLDLVKKARAAILVGEFQSLLSHHQELWQEGDQTKAVSPP